MHILFVCTGNICRSPTAEGVLRARAAERGLTHIVVDSAGTHGYHVGEAPDPRTIRAGLARGIDLSSQRARRIAPADFNDFDLILALDASHLRMLQSLAPKNSKAQLALFLNHAGLGPRDVPDPYYGDAEGFEQVLDLVELGVQSMLEKLK